MEKESDSDPDSDSDDESKKKKRKKKDKRRRSSTSTEDSKSHVVVELVLDQSYGSPGDADYVRVHTYLELEIHRIYIFLVVLYLGQQTDPFNLIFSLYKLGNS